MYDNCSTQEEHRNLAFAHSGRKSVPSVFFDSILNLLKIDLNDQRVSSKSERSRDYDLLENVETN
jgi:hypothetical protein